MHDLRFWLLYGLPALLGVTAAVALATAAARSPKLLWPLVAACLTGASGVFFLDYAFLDELLLWGLLAGGAAAVARGAVPRRVSRPSRFRTGLYLAFLAYLVLESLRGAFQYGDLRIFRWVLLYGQLALLTVLLDRWDFPECPPARLCRLMTATGAATFTAYLIHGAVYPGTTAHVLHGVWYNFLGIGSAGPAYAVFSFCIILPCAALALDRASRWAPGWLAVGLAGMICVFSNTRIGFTALFAFGCTVLAVYGLRTAFRYVVACVPAALCLFGIASLLAAEGYSYIPPAARHPFDPRGGDSERNLLLRASVDYLKKDPFLLAFGVGTYGFRYTVDSRERELRRKYKMDPVRLRYNAVIRPTGWAGWLAEFGLVGTLLYLAVAGGAFRALGNGVRGIGWAGIRRRLPLALSLILALGWGFVDDTRDILLLYLILMPGGLVEQLVPAFTAVPPEADDGADGLRTPDALPDSVKS